MIGVGVYLNQIQQWCGGGESPKVEHQRRNFNNMESIGNWDRMVKREKMRTTAFDSLDIIIAVSLPTIPFYIKTFMCSLNLPFGLDITFSSLLKVALESIIQKGHTYLHEHHECDQCQKLREVTLYFSIVLLNACVFMNA